MLILVFEKNSEIFRTPVFKNVHSDISTDKNLFERNYK